MKKNKINTALSTINPKYSYNQVSYCDTNILSFVAHHAEYSVQCHYLLRSQPVAKPCLLKPPD
jgi:hypothetical protein